MSYGKVNIAFMFIWKIESKTFDCMFIGYTSNSVAYRFLVLKSDVLECNTIIKTKLLNFLNRFFHFLRKFLIHPQLWMI